MNQEFLKSILHYDPEMGNWRWLINRRNNSIKIGARAGCFDIFNGYWKIQINGKRYLSSRLAWLYMMGDWPPFEIDHIDTNRSNDVWKNLREATCSQNMCNRNINSNNTSGIKGVHYNKKRCKWRAQIGINSKDKHLGWFNTLKEAAEAYQKAALELHGEFARTT